MTNDQKNQDQKTPGQQDQPKTGQQAGQQQKQGGQQDGQKDADKVSQDDNNKSGQK